MPKHRIFCLAVLIWAAAFSTAHALGLEIAVGGWQQDPSGDIGYKALSANDLLNVDNDLRYDKEERIMGRAKIDLPLFLPNVYLMASPTEFDGTGEKNTSFTFGDRTFDAAVPFYSKLTFDQYDVALYYGLPFLSTATADMLNVELGINVRIVDIEATVRQDTIGGTIDETRDVTVAVPQVYAAVQVAPLDWLAIEAEGRGLTINGDSMYSFIGRLRFNLAGPAFIAGGYRYDKVDVEEDDVNIDFTIKGPFAEVGLKF